MPSVTAYPTTDSAVSGSWTSPTNVQASDGNVASISLTQGNSGIREQGSYGFDALIPAGALITSVKLEVRHRVTNTTGANTIGARARVSGSDLTEQTDTSEPTSLLAVSYDITSLRAWARSDLLDANFKTRISGTKSGTPSTTAYEWDYVRVVVGYSMSGRRSVGTAASAASGNVTPGLPTGWQEDDVLILVVAAQDSVSVTATGWTVFGEAHTTGDPLRLTLFWRRAQAGDTAPTVTHTAGGAIVAQIAAYLGAATAGTPADVPGSGFPNAHDGSSSTVTTNDFTPSVADEVLVFVAASNNGASASGYSGTNPTFSEGFDSRGGAGGVGSTGIQLADGSKSDTTATGARTATLSVAANAQIGALFGIKPPTTQAPSRTLTGVGS